MPKNINEQLETVLGPYPLALLGTSKSESITAFLAHYGKYLEVDSYDPEAISGQPESRERDIRVVAAEKVQHVENHYQAQGLPGMPLIIGSDVLMYRGGRAQHKPDISEENMQDILDETISWYEQPFTAEWVAAFAAKSIGGGVGSVAMLRVFGEYEGIDSDEIVRNFNPESNARIGLVEIGTERQVDFILENSSAAEQVKISGEEATLLVARKVLPPHLLMNLLAEHEAVRDEDFELDGWQAVSIALLANHSD